MITSNGKEFVANSIDDAFTAVQKQFPDETPESVKLRWVDSKGNEVNTTEALKLSKTSTVAHLDAIVSAKNKAKSLTPPLPAVGESTGPASALGRKPDSAMLPIVEDGGVLSGLTKEEKARFKLASGKLWSEKGESPEWMKAASDVETGEMLVKSSIPATAIKDRLFLQKALAAMEAVRKNEGGKSAPGTDFTKIYGGLDPFIVIGKAGVQGYKEIMKFAARAVHEGPSAAIIHHTGGAVDRIKNGDSQTGQLPDKAVGSIFEHQPTWVARKINPWLSHVKAPHDKISSAEHDGIQQYLSARSDGEIPTTGLNDKQKAVVQAIDEAEMDKLFAKREGAWPMRAGGHSPHERQPNYIPWIMEKSFRDILKGGASPRKEEVRNRLIEWNRTKGGMTVEEATAVTDKHEFNLNLANQGDGKSVLYNAMREEAGLGIPPEMRGDFLDSVNRGATKTGIDLWYNTHFEKDPTMAAKFGVPDDGRGNKHPEQLDPMTGEKITPMWGKNADVDALFRDIAYMVSPENKVYETINRLATVGPVSILTSAKNVVQMITPLMTNAKVSEYHFAAKMINDMFGPGAQAAHQHALKIGAIKPSRNAGNGIMNGATDGANALIDVGNKAIGVESLETRIRVGFSSFMEQVAWNRYLTGDTKFFDKYAPHGWRDLPIEDAVTYAAANSGSRQAGTYGPNQLPNVLLPSSTQWPKYVFSLARWPIMASNEFVKNVVAPLEKGNVVPLVKATVGGLLTAEVIEWLVEKLQGTKPRELTWPEWAKLGAAGKPQDTAYTVMSKLDTAGNLGILGAMTLANIQMASGESPRSYNIMAMNAAGNAAQRAYQYYAAVAAGKADLSDLWTLGGQIARDNFQAIRAITPQPDVEGNREERLAKRVGFLAPETAPWFHTLRNPWSDASAYRDNNVELLEDSIAKRIKNTGKLPANPATAIRQPGYYNFVRTAQDQPSAKAALLRDVNTDIARRTLFDRAMIGGVRKAIRSTAEVTP